MSNVETDAPTSTETPASLREAAAKGRAALTEVDRLKKENLFLRAGIPTEGNKMTKLFFESWEGDDVAALKAEALEVGLLKAETTDDAAAQAAALAAATQAQLDQGQQAFREGLAPGQAPGPAQEQTVDAYDDAYAIAASDRKKGMNQQAVAQRAFDRIFSAAANGDKSVIFDPQDWARQQAQHSENGLIL